MTKRRIGLMLAICLAILPCANAWAEQAALTDSEQAALDYLGAQMEAPASVLMTFGEDVEDIYSELNWRSVADTLPEAIREAYKLVDKVSFRNAYWRRDIGARALKALEG